MIEVALPLLALAVLPLTAAQSNICYDYYNRPYYCNSGLSYGARIGIGIGIAAAGIILISLCMFWRRRRMQKQWSKYKPPALPTQASYGGGSNPYANNPPPPQGYYGQQSSYNNNNFGSNLAPPPQTYQPSMAGQYGGNYGSNRDVSDGNVNKPETFGNANGGGEGDHEHGYEWQQAREAERLERAQGNAMDAPPGYDVSAATTPQNTGGYAPPPGSPPRK